MDKVVAALRGNEPDESRAATGRGASGEGGHAA